MDTLAKGWFSEVSTLWPGQAFSLEVEEVLFDKKSEYQHVIVFKSKTYGTVLVLDGVIQATDRDEFAYQEMMTHVALCSHPNPKKVLVIGGGDGGILREITRHSSVDEIVLCEIDNMVIEASKQFLPNMAQGFSDPRVTIYNGDGAEYVRGRKGEFDVIIVDSSDPVGPAETLFTESFYGHMKQGLREGGIVCTQAECIWLHLELIKNMVDFSKNLFKHVEYGFVTIPTYPCGQIGFLLLSTGDSCKVPKRTMDVTNLKYYNSDIHSACFVLPQFARKALGIS